jgi:hypothetical protein
MDYRKEYISLKMVPLSEQSSLDEFHVHKMINISQWESFTATGSSSLIINATRVDNLVMQYIFRFDSPDDNFGRKVFKFSIIVYSALEPAMRCTFRYSPARCRFGSSMVEHQCAGCCAAWRNHKLQSSPLACRWSRYILSETKPVL